MRIIWLDDDINTVQLKGIYLPQRKDFDFILCETLEEFESKLEEDWDAAILDVIDSSGERTNYDIAFTKLITKYKDRPFFVFSGQDNILYKENSLQKILSKFSIERPYEHKIIYDKNNDIKLIFRHIKKAIEEKEIWQTEEKYKQVLSVFDIISTESRDIMLDVLMSIEGHKALNHKVYYTQLRMILEWMFRHANQIGLLHDKCINDVNKQVNLTESSRFLAGEGTKHLGVRLKDNKGHFPKLIAENVRNLLSVTGGASHTTEPDEKDLINLQEYWKTVNTSYLLYSLTFSLCDILIWYNKYQEENNNYAENISRWEESKASPSTEEQPKVGNIIIGKVTNFNDVGLAYIKPNGSTNSAENCCIGSAIWLQKDDELTIEFEERTMKSGKTTRVATKILEHKTKIDE